MGLEVAERSGAMDEHRAPCKPRAAHLLGGLCEASFVKSFEGRLLRQRRASKLDDDRRPPRRREEMPTQPQQRREAYQRDDEVDCGSVEQRT
jgi:hypothetical protein